MLNGKDIKKIVLYSVPAIVSAVGLFIGLDAAQQSQLSDALNGVISGVSALIILGINIVGIVKSHDKKQPEDK
jgi:hypothetical protein